MSGNPSKEAWSSRLGVILAVAGSAVGLGNFLRFPGLAAQYGSGAFMIAYFVSLVLLGIPICWAEWTLGRYAGQKGFRSSPGIFYALIRHPVGKYLGMLGIIIPVVIYMYYVYIESWCVAYGWYFLTGRLNLGNDVSAYGSYWANYVGAVGDGATFLPGHQAAIVFLLIVFALNFFLIYRGLVRGIEFFCKYAMPALMVIALIILARVLTLGTPDAARPDQNVLTGLGYMWNPGDWQTQLKNPQLWLTAAGQIFFSLSVGFGVIITYASYLSNRNDVVLSGLSANAANEFCEVALGGLITVPAAFIFLGAAGVVGQGTFSLGFKVLPLVLSHLPMPGLFGFLFFFLLFLAAITSSLSMLQPGIAFLEEGLGLNRKQSTTLLGLLTAIGCTFVVYFSKDLKALDTMDFWVGTVFIFIMATVIIIYFGWGMGIERGFEEAHRGAEMKIPGIYKFIMKFVSPAYLLIIFAMFVWFKVFGWDPQTQKFVPTSYVADLVGPHPNVVARVTVLFLAITVIFFGLLTALAGRRWDKEKSKSNNPPKP
ncbi:MAG TPA: sodium-dependent transporter [Verrucomicrobiae bacterium]